MQRLAVDVGVDVAGLQERRQERCEADALGGFRIIERLDAEPVARQRHRAGVAFVDREGEHAVKPLDAGLAPFVERLEHHLGVAMREEVVAGRDQLFAQFRIVVDAAVEDDGQAERRVDHRLAGLFRQVDDLQPPVPEGDAPLRDDAAAVGAARRKRFCHPCHGRRIGKRAIESDFSGNSTHIRLLFLVFWSGDWRGTCSP